MARSITRGRFKSLTEETVAHGFRNTPLWSPARGAIPDFDYSTATWFVVWDNEGVEIIAPSTNENVDGCVKCYIYARDELQAFQFLKEIESADT